MSRLYLMKFLQVNNARYYYNYWKWRDRVFSIFLISFHPRDSHGCAPPFSCKYFPINRICTKTTRFLCFSNPQVYSRTHFSSSGIEIYSSSPFVSILKYSYNGTGSMIFLPIFWKIWYFILFFKNSIPILTLYFRCISIIERFRFRRWYRYSKIYFILINSRYKDTKKRNKFQFSSRNLNLKSLESAATRLLSFSNIYWWSFLRIYNFYEKYFQRAASVLNNNS